MTPIELHTSCEGRTFVGTGDDRAAALDLARAAAGHVVEGGAIDGLHLYRHNGGIGLALSPAAEGEAFVREWAALTGRTVVAHCSLCKATARGACAVHPKPAKGGGAPCRS